MIYKKWEEKVKKKILISISLLFLFILCYEIELKSMSSNAQKAQSDLWKSLCGKVVNKDGKGLSGVKIILKSDVSGSSTTVSDEEGNFRFFRLPPGPYNVEATLKGYKMISVSGKEVKEGFEALQFNHSTETQVSQPILNITMCLDDEGGIGTQKKPNGTQNSTDQSETVLSISKTTIFYNSGLNKIVNLLVQNDEKIRYSFYISKDKIYAKSGIAKVESIKKKLYDITELPEDSKYKYDGLELENNCVYTIRIGRNDENRIIFRVLNKLENKVEIEYYIVPKKNEP